MQTLSITSARAMRDGGIDAIAALNTALMYALVGIPEEGSAELKLAFGKAMGEVIFEIINPAICSFPELAVDETTWSAIARARAGQRCDCDGETDDGNENDLETDDIDPSEISTAARSGWCPVRRRWTGWMDTPSESPVRRRR